jgi:hypothetical protein
LIIACIQPEPSRIDAEEVFLIKVLRESEAIVVDSAPNCQYVKKLQSKRAGKKVRNVPISPRIKSLLKNLDGTWPVSSAWIRYANISELQYDIIPVVKNPTTTL